MQRVSSKLTYANVVSTVALCIAVGGGAAFAAGKIDSSQIAAGGVHTRNLQQRSVTSGKLAVGAVRSNQIAPRAVDTTELAPGAVRSGQLADGAVGGPQLAKGAVGSEQLAKGAVGAEQLASGAVGSGQIGAGAVTPAQMQFPVSLAARPGGGTLGGIAITHVDYPLSDAGWTSHSGAVDLVVGNVTATVPPTHTLVCEALLEFAADGEYAASPLGTVRIVNPSETETLTTTAQVTPFALLAEGSRPTELTARVHEGGPCQGQLTIESTSLRVIELG
jgi:trimeric autotransporter adhesin